MLSNYAIIPLLRYWYTNVIMHMMCLIPQFIIIQVLEHIFDFAALDPSKVGGWHFGIYSVKRESISRLIPNKSSSSILTALTSVLKYLYISHTFFGESRAKVDTNQHYLHIIPFSFSEPLPQNFFFFLCCCYHPLCDVSQQSWFGFFFVSQIFQFYSPPPPPLPRKLFPVSPTWCIQ